MNGVQLSALHNFIRHLMTAVANATLYSVSHQQVSRLTAAASDELQACIGEQDELVLMVVDDQLIVEGAPQPANLYIGRFIRALKTRGVEHVTFSHMATPGDLTVLVAGLAKPGGIGQDLYCPDTIRIGRVAIHHPSCPDGVAPDELQNIPLFSEMAHEELVKFLDIYDQVKKNGRLSVTGIYDIVTNFVRAFKQDAGSLLTFAPLRSMDEYTFTHSTNVCILNLAQAMALGVEGQLLHDIGIAAMLHDIGKLFIPEEIINKPGKLTDEEWQIIRQHPVKGAQHLLDTPGVPHLAVVTAYEHHMKFNMTGYPSAPASWHQNLCSQMTTISDVFDALRTKRSYRGALEWEEVAGSLGAMAGTDLHPVLTRNFLKVLGRLEQQEA